MRKVVILGLLVVLAASMASGGSAKTTDVGGGLALGTDSQGVVSAFPSGTWNTGIQVQNLTSSQASVVVDFYNESGTLVYSKSDTVSGNGSRTFYLPNYSESDLPAGRYSAVVSSDQQVAAVANQVNYDGNGMSDSYLGISTGASEVGFPLVFRNYGSWNSLFAVQNISPTVASVSARFFPTGSSSAAYTKTVNVQPYASAYFDISSSDYDALGSFLGSVVVTGTRSIVAVINETKQSGSSDVLAMFGGFTASATSYVAPLVYKNYNPNDTSGWGSGIQVQNRGSSADTVTMVFSPVGSSTTYTKSKVINANAADTFYMPGLEFDHVPNGLYGSAVISSTGQPIAVLVNNVKYATGVATGYNAFPISGGSRTIVAPLVYNKYPIINNDPTNTNGWTTGIQVYNMGASTDVVTMTFVTGNSVSGGPWTVVKSIPGGRSDTFYMPSTSIPGNNYGSATIQSGSNDIVAIINSTKYLNGVATSYSGINQ